MGRSRRAARRKEAIYGCFGGSSSSDEGGQQQPRGLAAVAADAAARSSKRRRRRSSSRSSSDGGGPIQFVKGGVLQPGEPKDKSSSSKDSSSSSKKSSSSSSSKQRDAAPQPFAFDKKQLKLSIKKPKDDQQQQQQQQPQQRERQELSSKDAHVLQQLGLDYSESDEEGSSSKQQRQQQQEEAGSPDGAESKSLSDSADPTAAAAAAAADAAAASDSGSDSSSSSKRSSRRSSRSSSKSSRSSGSRGRRSRSPAFVFKRSAAAAAAAAGGDPAASGQQQQQGRRSHHQERGWGQAKMAKAYGKGFALLQRMGFKGGGLGRDGSGLVAPLEVKIRKKNQALQDEGERLKPGDKGAAPLQAIPDPESPRVFRWKAPEEAPAADGGVLRLSGLSSEWKVGKERKQRLVKTAAQIAVEGRMLLQQQQQQQQQLRVIDMTGPQVRLLQNAEEVGEALRQQQHQQLQQEELIRLNGLSSSSGGGIGVDGEVPLLLLQQALRQQIRAVERDLHLLAGQKQREEQQLLDASLVDQQQQQQQQQQQTAAEHAQELAAAIRDAYSRIKRRGGSDQQQQEQQQEQQDSDRWSDDEAQPSSSSSSSSSSSGGGSRSQQQQQEPDYQHVTGGATVEWLLDEMLSWRKCWREAFVELHAAGAAAALLRLLLQRVSVVWKPLEAAAPQLAASVGRWFEAFATLHHDEEEVLLRQLQQQQQQQHMQQQLLQQQQQHRLVVGKAYGLLQHGVEETVGALLRRQLLSSWVPLDAAAAGVALLEAWLPALPAASGLSLLQQPAALQLRRSLDTWNPLGRSSNSNSGKPLQQWLLPFMSLLDRAVVERELLLALQHKLVVVLSAHWKASDRSAVSLLFPWRSVFSSSMWGELLQQAVVPQLLERLQQLEIKPQQQDLTPLKDVLAWESVFPTELLARVLAAGFLPQWLQVLRLWMVSPAADPAELRLWYRGWQAAFPQALLQHPLLERGFVEGLKIIGAGPAAAAAKLQQQQQHPLLPLQPSPAAAAAAGAAGGGLWAQQPQAPAAAPPPTPEQSHQVSLLELLQGMAAEEGLVCRPKPGRIERGMQVYLLGRLSFFVEGSVIFAKHKNHEPWKPFNAKELLALATKPRA
ncbi:hypothetical protein Efla_002586 [Eimeria flavescens]